MTYSKWLAAFGAGTMTLLGACASAPEPTARVIYAQPTFDKLGNPSCRPGNVPIGETYRADLPLCTVIGGAPAVMLPVGDDADSSIGTEVVVPGETIDPTDPNGGNQNRNQNQNQNQNQSGG